MTVSDQAKNRRRLSLDDAIEQVTQYFGFDGIKEIEIDGDVYEIRAKVLWTPDQITAMNKLQDWLDSLDHDEVEVRNPITNEVVVNPVTNKPVTEKVLVTPHRKNGKSVDPSFESRYLAALWGEDRAKKFETAGGTYGLVTMIMAQMDDEFDQWQRNRRSTGDSKSV